MGIQTATEPLWDLLRQTWQRGPWRQTSSETLPLLFPRWSLGEWLDLSVSGFHPLKSGETKFLCRRLAVS